MSISAEAASRGKRVLVLGRGQIRQVPWPEECQSMDVGDVSISNARVKELIGWRPKTGLEEGLEKSWAFFEERLRVYWK